MPRLSAAGSHRSAARGRAARRRGGRLQWRLAVRRGRQLLQHASPTAWVLGALLLISVLLLTVNWLYQVARKP
ncbi:MAG: hypothetical protein JOZ93_05380, partial [Sinobacteraceae bacterium]|nr:hypothetical protein [Nevskiaceae bacterium]